MHVIRTQGMLDGGKQNVVAMWADWLLELRDLVCDCTAHTPTPKLAVQWLNRENRHHRCPRCSKQASWLCHFVTDSDLVREVLSKQNDLMFLSASPTSPNTTTTHIDTHPPYTPHARACLAQLLALIRPCVGPSRPRAGDNYRPGCLGGHHGSPLRQRVFVESQNHNWLCVKVIW